MLRLIISYQKQKDKFIIFYLVLEIINFSDNYLLKLVPFVIFLDDNFKLEYVLANFKLRECKNVFLDLCSFKVFLYDNNEHIFNTFCTNL
jgi:hypothetical protein